VKSMGALEPLLRAPRPIIVAHNADFEIRQFSSIGVPLNGVVDTLMMSRKLRPDLPSHSLQSCCKYILGLSISKQEQRSNWAQRPLSASQIQYAALDAEVTVKLYQALRAIEAVETIDPDLSIEGLMRELTKAVEERLALMAPIADRVAKLNAREAALRSAMQSRLLAGEQPYEGALGRCKLFHKRNYEIDPVKVRQEFPALAAAAIEEVVDPRKFENLLKEHSVDPGAITELLKEGASTTRVSISLSSLLDPKPTS
ncbi:MAG: hypothetical protein J0M12_08340, partial [Deltaproteobacteria bacterium]|nr:hypothetical protein [Deltaproteobacteria bacterium]